MDELPRLRKKAQVSAEHEVTAPEAMHSDAEAGRHLASSVGQTLPH